MIQSVGSGPGDELFRHRCDGLHRAQPDRVPAASARGRSTCSCVRAPAAGWRSSATAGAWGEPRCRSHRRRLPAAARLRRPDRRAARKGRPLLPPRGDLRHDRRRGKPARGQRRGHAQRRGARRGDRGRALPHGELDRRGRPLQGRVARGHVRRGGGPRHASVLPHQARVGAGRTRGVRPAVAGVPAGDRGRRLEDRRDRQDRRPVLLLQADPATAQHGAPVDSADRRSRGGRSTSSRSTSSSRRWITSPTSTMATARRSASPTPTRGARAR